VTIAQLGEFGLIDRLAALVAPPGGGRLTIGIGDDAAAWLPSPGTTTVATADGLVEGVHFDLTTTSWHDLGWKALAENVSDVAAMGCQPRYALIVLGAGAHHAVEDLEALYRGLNECAAAFGCVVVGGDVVRSPCLSISVTLVGESQPAGEAEEPLLLRRSSAQPGDVLAVTGPLGGSAAGLRLLSDARAEPPVWTAGERALLCAHRRPQPRVGAGLALVNAGVRCAIDVSDGLVADVGHLCERSGVDAEIDADRVPVHPAARERFGEAAVDMALTGGEDYELVCAAPAAVLARASALLAHGGEPRLVVIGEVVSQRESQPAVRVRRGGRLLAVPQGGYQHFSPATSSAPATRGPDAAAR
jgi:thiamine-monophosphate kinase